MRTRRGAARLRGDALVRDIRACSGMAPGEFIRYARADANALVLG